MLELYWLTRLDGLHNCFITFLVISAIAITMFTIVYYCCKGYKDRDEDCNIRLNTAQQVLKIAIPTFVFSIIGTLFIPTAKDAYIIYGMGTVVDYVQSNKTLQHIPDKAVNALDKWVTTITSEDKKSNKSNSDEDYNN